MKVKGEVLVPLYMVIECKNLDTQPSPVMHRAHINMFHMLRYPRSTLLFTETFVPIKSAHCRRLCRPIAAERGRISVFESGDSRVPHKRKSPDCAVQYEEDKQIAIDVTDLHCPIPLDTMASEPLEYYQDPDTGNIMANKV